jgi:hypothetical protein
METRLLGISFVTSTTVINPTAQSSTTTTSFQVSNVTILAILGAFVAYSTGQLDHLGSFLGNLLRIESSDRKDEELADQQYQFLIVLSNRSCKAINLDAGIKQLQNLAWSNGGGVMLPTPTIQLLDTLNQEQLVTLLNYRMKLPNCDYLTKSTLWALSQQYTDAPLSSLLKTLRATDVGDKTGGSSDNQETAWAKGLFNRLTTGGPNGSMGGKIAVNFMSTVPVSAQAVFDFSKASQFADPPTQNPFVKILKEAVTSAAQSAAQGLADYLKTLKPSAADTSDRQTATVVKGIRDTMPSTGRTVAQLAVFNALGNPDMASLDRDQQLRVAYTVANSTRAAVEAVGNHVADLYQSNGLPTEEELEAIGARGLLDFLKTVGTTVANGVMQMAPVVLNAVVNSATANNALGGALPPSVAASRVGVHELDTPTKIVLASRIVNGTPNPQASVVTDKAVTDLADRQSNLGAQATLDTFTNTTTSPSWRTDDPPQELRNKFRDVALAVANISPTFSNVTDIGATNLVTDTSLKHADALRSNTLEMGIRSCANMIADHKSAEMLYKVHLYRIKNGTEVQPRGFLDFLKTAVPIAASIAKTAAPALLALL